ncbi:DUF982 domain-containing protein [Neorhizobium sp. T25_13]|uniref:DUF982 domain-containing protein n=1 Tax=Neorhizobium sp. T25_13 TaxID=2093830 RepID=UPI000CF9CC8B|nr:DUF982 domain-containing protein [Neorhizobium sp. T25_13]
MTERTWNAPVNVALPGIGRRDVNGPFEALALLTEGWPAMTGPHFVRAKIACKAALDERLTAEQARRAFEKAAAEANRNLN